MRETKFSPFPEDSFAFNFKNGKKRKPSANPLFMQFNFYNLFFSSLIACKRTLKMNIAVRDKEGNTQQNGPAQILMGNACLLTTLKCQS